MKETSTIELEESLEQMSSTSIDRGEASINSRTDLNNMELYKKQTSKIGIENSLVLSTENTVKCADSEDNKSGQIISDTAENFPEDSLFTKSFDSTSCEKIQNDSNIIPQTEVGIKIIDHSLSDLEMLSQTSCDKTQYEELGQVRNTSIVDNTDSTDENRAMHLSTIYFNTKKQSSAEEIPAMKNMYPEGSTSQSLSAELIKKNIHFAPNDLHVSDNSNETNEGNMDSEEGKETSQADEDVTKTSEIKLNPFSLHWSFGYNKTVPVLNLTKLDHVIAFADSQAGVLYNYHDKTMTFLQGHYNSITCMATDQTGSWVAAADEGDDSTLIVWDTKSYLPIYTLFGPHARGTSLVGISPNARYIVTVSPWPNQIVQLWLWTLGPDTPEASLELSEEYGRVQKLIFSSDVSEYVIATTNTHVLFISFEGKQLKLHEPHFNLASKQGCFFTDSVYMSNTHIAMSATTTGHVYEWSDVPYQNAYTVFLFNNNKELLNYKKLQNEAITHILSVDNHIVTITCSGLISFYDRRLCLLYWISNFKNERVVSISFGLLPRSDLIMTNCQHGEQDECSKAWEAIHIVHSDATLKKKPFSVRNFIVSTVSGKIMYIHYSRKKIETLVTCSDSPLTAIDSYPNNHFICAGNASGTCFLFDTKQKKTLITQKINSAVFGKVEISYLKYSYDGSVLACGVSDGSLWLLDPLLLKPIPDMLITNSSDPITKIVFSFNSAYLAHADDSFCVTLYSLENGITMLNKYKAHYKPIKDIVFASNEDFYSIAEDRFVVHYNIYRPDDVHVSPLTRIEQSALPLSMCLYPSIDDKPQKLIISNSEFKYRLLKTKPAVKCCKTAQAPITSSPVSFMMVLPQRDNKKKRYIVFHCDKHLGIQILPVDGNPFKYITTVTSSKKISRMCLSVCGDYIFTISESGYNLTMWQINTVAVDMMEEIGGEGLKPYFHLLEGGQDGPLFYQMQQFFYLAQLLHQGDYPSINRSVADKLLICDLPDVLRAIGYFPSEFELQNIVTEVSCSMGAASDIREIQFDDFVRLYINHRPATGISKQQIKDAFLEIAEKPEDDSEPYIQRSSLLNILKYYGERLPHTQVTTYLRALTEHSRAGLKEAQYGCSETECKDGFLYGREKITFEDFLHDILGYPEEETEVINDDNVPN